MDLSVEPLPRRGLLRHCFFEEPVDALSTRRIELPLTLSLSQSDLPDQPLVGVISLCLVHRASNHFLDYVVSSILPKDTDHPAVCVKTEEPLVPRMQEPPSHAKSSLFSETTLPSFTFVLFGVPHPTVSFCRRTASRIYCARDINAFFFFFGG